MADKKFLLDVIKEVNGYSRDEDYPFWARKDYEDDILIVYPARLGSKGYANVELSDRHGVPGKLFVRGISYSESDWSSPKTPWDRYEDDYGFVSEKDFLKVLTRLKKKADKQMTSTKIHTKRDPDADNGIIVYKGVKKLGEVWKGLDKKWHHSGKSAEYGGFRTKKEALEELLKPPSQRIMDYQPFDGYPRLASAKDLLREVQSIKSSIQQKHASRQDVDDILEDLAYTLMKDYGYDYYDGDSDEARVDLGLNLLVDPLLQTLKMNDGEYGSEVIYDLAESFASGKVDITFNAHPSLLKELKRIIKK